jgi:hypothetical protein
MKHVDTCVNSVVFLLLQQLVDIEMNYSTSTTLLPSWNVTVLIYL